jgi:hypothetical protein
VYLLDKMAQGLIQTGLPVIGADDGRDSFFHDYVFKHNGDSDLLTLILSLYFFSYLSPLPLRMFRE